MIEQTRRVLRSRSEKAGRDLPTEQSWTAFSWIRLAAGCER